MSVEEGEDKSTKEGILFIESSAKAGFNIKALFRKLATALPGMESAQAQPAANLIDIKLSAPKKGKFTPEEKPASAPCSC